MGYFILHNNVCPHYIYECTQTPYKAGCSVETAWRPIQRPTPGGRAARRLEWRLSVTRLGGRRAGRWVSLLYWRWSEPRLLRRCSSPGRRPTRLPPASRKESLARLGRTAGRAGNSFWSIHSSDSSEQPHTASTLTMLLLPRSRRSNLEIVYWINSTSSSVHLCRFATLSGSRTR